MTRPELILASKGGHEDADCEALEQWADERYLSRLHEAREVEQELKERGGDDDR